MKNNKFPKNTNSFDLKTISVFRNCDPQNLFADFPNTPEQGIGLGRRTFFFKTYSLIIDNNSRKSCSRVVLI